eukprot:scaffold9881_cov243-Skeletonema_marinoi.AAC.1
MQASIVDECGQVREGTCHVLAEEEDDIEGEKCKLADAAVATPHPFGEGKRMPHVEREVCPGR